MRFRRFLGGRIGVAEDSYRLKAGSDGVVREDCWFCGNEVEFRPGETTGSDAAVVIVEQLGGGEPMHGVCHSSCAERAKGSLTARI
jgi:hypothetical protein